MFDCQPGRHKPKQKGESWEGTVGKRPRGQAEPGAYCLPPPSQPCSLLMFDTWSTFIHPELSRGLRQVKSPEPLLLIIGGGGEGTKTEHPPYSSLLLQCWQTLPSQGGGASTTHPTYLARDFQPWPLSLYLPGSSQDICHLKVLKCKPQHPGPDGIHSCIPILDMLCFFQAP